MSLSVDTKISRGAAFLITALTFILGLFIGGTIISSFESMRWTRTMQHWYGIDLYKLDQIALILYFFALWSFIGAWRILRRSLQYRDKPWIWIGFITSTSFFLSGFSSIQSYSIDTFGWPILVSLATLILTCATEATDTIRYRSFIHSLQQKSYGDAFRAVPLWVVSFAALTICMLLNVLLAGQEKFLNVLLFLTSLIIFVVRDLLAFHAIYWMPNVRRPAMGVVAYAVTLYGFFPALAATINHSYRLFFFPNAANNFISGYWLMLLIETGIASYFALRYWKATMNKTDNP